MSGSKERHQTVDLNMQLGQALMHGRSTPSHKSSGYIKKIQSLLDQGADVNALITEGISWKTSTLQIAIDSVETLKLIPMLLQSGLQINHPVHTNTEGDSPLMQAIGQQGRGGGAKALKVTELLIKQGASVLGVGKDKKTVLHLMAECFDFSLWTKKGTASFFKPGTAGVPYIVQTVLNQSQKEGLNMNAPDRRHFTPLHYAALNGSLVYCELLIKMGADVHCKTINGNTALHKAIEGPHPEVVQMLLKHGVDVAEKNNHGDSAQDRRKSWKSATRQEKVQETIEVLGTVLEKEELMQSVQGHLRDIKKENGIENGAEEPFKKTRNRL